MTVLALLLLWGVLEVRRLRLEVQRLRDALEGPLRAERQVRGELVGALRSALAVGRQAWLVVEQAAPSAVRDADTHDRGHGSEGRYPE